MMHIRRTTNPASRWRPGCNEGLGHTLPDDEHPYAYASTQATNCAGCGEYKHAPLRIDAMG